MSNVILIASFSKRRKMCSNCSDLTGEAAGDMSLAICSQGAFLSTDLRFSLSRLPTLPAASPSSTQSK